MDGGDLLYLVEGYPGDDDGDDDNDDDDGDNDDDGDDDDDGDGDDDDKPFAENNETEGVSNEAKDSNH